jgi:hypothetical protein
MTVRFLERHLLATVTAYMTSYLTTAGWVTGTINFAAPALTIINTHPDADADVQVVPQTLAITLGDSPEEGLSQLGGGLYQIDVPVFFDVYSTDSSTVMALAADVRDAVKRQKGTTYQEWYTGTGVDVSGALIYFEHTVGPERPIASSMASNGDFRKHWRVVKTMACVEFLD